MGKGDTIQVTIDEFMEQDQLEALQTAWEFKSYQTGAPRVNH